MRGTRGSPICRSAKVPGWSQSENVSSVFFIAVFSLNLQSMYMKCYIIIYIYVYTYIVYTAHNIYIYIYISKVDTVYLELDRLKKQLAFLPGISQRSIFCHLGMRMGLCSFSRKETSTEVRCFLGMGLYTVFQACITCITCWIQVSIVKQAFWLCNFHALSFMFHRLLMFVDCALAYFSSVAFLIWLGRSPFFLAPDFVIKCTFFFQNGRPPECNFKLLYFKWSPPWHVKAYILTFYLSDCLTFILTFYLPFFLALYLTSILTFYLPFFLAFYLASVLAFYLAYILQVYLTSIRTFYLAFSLTFSSGILSAISSKILRVRGPAGNTLILCLLFGSGEEHCDLALAVEVRRGTLCSWACCSGPAGNTAI